MSSIRGLVIAAAAACIASATIAGSAVGLGVPGRSPDPVVLRGSQVRGLIGSEPTALVAFTRGIGWRQVPVQVDERGIVNLRAVRGNTGPSDTVSPVQMETYKDAGTHAGGDANPLLDADDEIAIMAMDAGRDAAGIVSPAGVVAGSRTRVKVTDPLGHSTRYLYLFRSRGGLRSGAGRRYVDYTFNLLSGDYLSTYNFGGPANPENSSVSTGYYSHHLSDRWVDDQLRIKAGDATGVDILDRDKVQFAPGVCDRSEDTFKVGGGGFIINKSGPVRAIRSYVGANSGTYTQRQEIYYQRRQEMTTILRVHVIPSVLSFIDYSPEASGMTYRNSLNPTGVTVDGVPDSPIAGRFSWEQITGAQGSLSSISRIQTDIPGQTVTSYFLDQANPSPVPGNPEIQCTGDAHAYGASGTFLTSGFPDTDPSHAGTIRRFETTRSMFYDAPGASADLASLRSRQVDAPLSESVRSEADPTARPKLKVRVIPRSVNATPGKVARLLLRVTNAGNTTIRGLRVCPRANSKRARVGRCHSAMTLTPDESWRPFFKVVPKRGPSRGGAIIVRFRITARGFKARTATARLR